MCKTEKSQKTTGHGNFGKKTSQKRQNGLDALMRWCFRKIHKEAHCIETVFPHSSNSQQDKRRQVTSSLEVIILLYVVEVIRNKRKTTTTKKTTNLDSKQTETNWGKHNSCQILNNEIWREVCLSVCMFENYILCPSHNSMKANCNYALSKVRNRAFVLWKTVMEMQLLSWSRPPKINNKRFDAII